MKRSPDHIIRRKIDALIIDKKLTRKGIRRSQVISVLTKKFYVSERTVYRILDERLTDKKDLESAEKLLQEYYNAGRMTIEILMRDLFNK